MIRALGQETPGGSAIILANCYACKTIFDPKAKNIPAGSAARLFVHCGNRIWSRRPLIGLAVITALILQIVQSERSFNIHQDFA